MIINDLFNNKKSVVAEGMAGKVVFRGTGADGGTYEIIQSSPTDFMIHANGRHIDTYGSLQRAMSVLQNEVPGLQQGMAEGNNEQDINDPLDPNYGGNRNRSVKRNIQSRLGHDERGDARVRAGQLRSTHARHKPQLPESAMDDNAIWNRYGHYNAQDLMDEFPNLSPKDAQTIVNYAEYGWSSSNSQKFRNEVVARVKTAMGLVEGSELKQAKRKYNQAAKDANADQVGAGKKIDTMKKSLRQKDVYNKKQGVAEGWRDIYNLNKQKIGTNPNLIKPDTVLKMPDGNRYIVKPGDTLSSIAKNSGAKSAQSSTPPKDAAGPTYYSLPPSAVAPVKPAPVKPAGAQDDSPYIFDPRSGQGGVKPDRIADVFQNPKLPPPLTRDEIEQQMMQPDFGGPNAPGYKHTVQGAEGEEYEFDSGQEAKDFVDRIEQLRLRDRALGGLGAAKSESISSKKKGMAEDDGFDVVSNYQTMHTTDTGNKANQTYTGATIQKNPATGQQKSLASWDHTDPATGKNYSGSNYIDAQGNAEVQKNYEESKNKVNEVSLGNYSKKAMMSKAMAQTDRFFGRDDPAKVAAANRTIANRERGLAGADARRKPYTPPPVDQDKQRRDLADKYPNIDELVRRAELNRDPQYDRADGQAYYNGRDAEHNYHKLKQIQRMIRGAELDEMDFGGTGQTTDSDTGDITTSFNQGPISVSQTKTPGGYTKQTDQRFDLGPATMAQKTVGPNIGAGQLAGTTTKTATNNMTGQSQQQVKGVGFGGASGANVGKNYVGSSDDELAQHAASVFNTNESVDLIRHLAGIKPVR